MTEKKKPEDGMEVVICEPGTDAALRLNLYQRLHRIMDDVTYVQRERKDGMKYSIVSHDAVTAAVRPAMLRWRVTSYISEMRTEQSGTRTEFFCKIKFVNIDNPADQLETMSFGYGLDAQDKGPGKAMSYAIKYALMKTFLMEAGEEDPDFHQMMKTPKGEDDPVFQNIRDFSDELDGLQGVEALNKSVEKWKAYLSDAAKKYPTEVNEARAKFAKLLAEAKKKEEKK